MTPIHMPQVGQDIPRARIVEWTKRVGDMVRTGDVIAVVESDKATFEVQADQSGVLLKIDVGADEEGEVFKPIAWVGQPGEERSIRPATVPAAATPGAAAGVEPQPATDGCAPIAVERERPVASPSARRLAREHGVDLATVRGTGPGGRIVKEDVLAAVADRRCSVASATQMPLDKTTSAATSMEPTTGDEIIPFSRTRRRMAERLTQSKQSIPHFHLFQHVDMTAAQTWRRALNDANGSRVTVTDLVIHATARALREFRRLNAHVERDNLILRAAIQVGVATALEDGLLVPVIPHADRKDLVEISQFSKQIVEAARRGVVDPNLAGTFTVSSLGQFGVPTFLPIINPPECALLGVGAIEPRVMPVPDGIGVRQMMTLTLACDHRAMDGAYAARFLTRLKELLEHPAQDMSVANNPQHQ